MRWWGWFCTFSPSALFFDPRLQLWRPALGRTPGLCEVLDRLQAQAGLETRQACALLAEIYLVQREFDSVDLKGAKITTERVQSMFNTLA
jgi:hypothetical protein